ncbi:hypothetical protein R3W88_003629 [Solanum pinnatisectum]|uniref:phosphoribosylformylglycinamidine synthase n=1 Tax=Solanum pinnatisectum TaxID=50273 RepID=A0AAV9MT84_9SOLN|nr:hypothetical protein R3W88_003629 [Solanum pinnatisectum]
MATSAWDIAATEFLQGFHRQKLALPRHSSRQTNHLLWGTLPKSSPIPYSHKNLRLRSHIQAKIRVVVSKDVSSLVNEDSSKFQEVVEKVIHLYRVPFLQDSATAELLKLVQTKISNQIIGLRTEQCFNIGLSSDLSGDKLSMLKWVLGETYEPESLGSESFLNGEKRKSVDVYIIKIGPWLSFTTAWSANAVSICQACGLTEINRMECSRKYLLYVNGSFPNSQISAFASMVHDRMTEFVYAETLSSFKTSIVPEEVRYIPIMKKGRKALEEINEKIGLAFDEQDLKYYTKLFRDDIKRSPTNVELFDVAQSNSEHSRHWFFTGKLVLDGQLVDKTLIQSIKSILLANLNNSVIGFKDNSSVIKGFPVKQLRPTQPGSTCPLDVTARFLDILFTAETHNFPCVVAPYPGAETYAGSRIRDTYATERGSIVVASIAGYCVGNLNLEELYAPWEDRSFTYPANLASPLQILIDASNGASDYGNKFGELPSGERMEWLKPIMFSAGIGQIDHLHLSRGEPEIGMLVVKIGRPAYRIGMGSGAASSMVSGQNDAELDFNAMQRGDAEMAHKLYRVIRACVEIGENNPIISIHDQGAGGNCNVVNEIIYPEGAKIDIRAIVIGDHTMSEQDAILVKPESCGLLQAICAKERVPMAIIGTINIDLELEKVLGDMPKKTFELNRMNTLREPLDIAPATTVLDSLKRVLRLLSVCSKRFLTTKVDRCVTGLVAQQQTVGPLQIPLADVVVIAQTYTGLTGGACSIGEQPIKGLLDPKAMARLAVGEALTNLVWAKVTSLSDVKASGNWMYAAKLDGEGAAMYDAAVALSEAMIELGITNDGGKDSLSMAAQASREVVKALGNLVISTYVTCPDITKMVTPDLKLGDDGVLLHIDLAKGKQRLDGSALAQVFDQIGDESPDVDDVSYLKTVFNEVQNLISDELISAGHDISDRGLIVAALEMIFARNYGINLDLVSSGSSVPQTLFAEELGLLIEVSWKNFDLVLEKLRPGVVLADIIGQVNSSPIVELRVDGETHLKEKTSVLRDMWEDTSFQLENSKPKVAVIREEGSNGDREMAAAFYAAGFEPWDVAMSDLLNGDIKLDEFRGIVFVGDFSYADVLDSAKGWAASICFNQPLLNQFQAFYNRPDTFSLGVCNGCQLMALLCWVPGPQVGGVLGVGRDPSQPRFVHNETKRFECRFTSVTIEESPSIMFKGMEGSTLAYFPDESVFNHILGSNLAPVKYCDDDGRPTDVYPFNLNGSPLGVAAICSPDGDILH